MAKKSSDNITEKDMQTGRIYKCENCETKCDGKIQLRGINWCVGRAETNGKNRYMCSRDCATYSARETDRIRFNELIKGLTEFEIPMLREIMSGFIAEGWDAKFVVKLIKMDKWYIKLLTTIMERQTDRDIIAVELVKFSEFVMEVAEEFNSANTDMESGDMNGCVVLLLTKKTGMSYYTLCNTAMWADSFGKNTKGRLDVWC